MSDITETDRAEENKKALDKAAALTARLTPWKVGQSGNPSGRPKGSRNRRTIIREILDNIEVKAIDLNTGEELDHMIPVAERITLAQVLKAIAGDPKAYELLMDGGFGKVADKVKNEVTFKQMGRVTAAPARPASSAPVIEGQAVEILPEPEPAKELTFDIGAAPPDPNAEEPLEVEGDEGEGNE